MSTSKKIGLTILGFLLAGILVIAALVTFQPSFFIELFNPEISTRVHRVNVLNEENASVDIELGLYNKTFIPITIDIADFLVEMDGAKLATSVKPLKVKIKPFSRNQLSIPVELQMRLLKETSRNFNPNRIDTSTYDISLNYEMKTFFYESDPMKFVKTFVYPSLGLPKVEINKVEVLKSNLRTQNLRIHVGILNPNPNDIILVSPHYTVQIDDREEFITNNLGDKLELKKFSVTLKTIEIEIDNKKIWQLIGELIGNGKDLSIKLLFEGNLQNASDMMKNTEIILEVNGDLKALIETSKTCN